jgi:hypothetical protein
MKRSFLGTRSVRVALALLVVFVAVFGGLTSVTATELFLAEAGALPGKLWRSSESTGAGIIHRRAARPDAAFPHAIMQLNQNAVGAEGVHYYCSGLDGCLMHLLNGRNEIMLFEYPGQIRDLATTDEEHAVYFSVVATPQNGEPLADGQILRRDMWEGQPSVLATVRQADVGHNWWGTFALQDDAIYLATLDSPSKLFRMVPGEAPQQVFTENTHNIRGLTADPQGGFYFTTTSGDAYRTDDFQTVTPVLHGERHWADVAAQPVVAAPNP